MLICLSTPGPLSAQWNVWKVDFVQVAMCCQQTATIATPKGHIYPVPRPSLVPFASVWPQWEFGPPPPSLLFFLSGMRWMYSTYPLTIWQVRNYSEYKYFISELTCKTISLQIQLLRAYILQVSVHVKKLNIFFHLLNYTLNLNITHLYITGRRLYFSGARRFLYMQLSPCIALSSTT